MLTNPEDSAGLEHGTLVTVWRYSPEHLAIAKTQGTITRVGYAMARFTVTKSETDPRWQEGENPLRPKAPVYLALPG